MVCTPSSQAGDESARPEPKVRDRASPDLPGTPGVMVLSSLLRTHRHFLSFSRRPPKSPARDSLAHFPSSPPSRRHVSWHRRRPILPWSNRSVSECGGAPPCQIASNDAKRRRCPTIVSPSYPWYHRLRRCLRPSVRICICTRKRARGNPRRSVDDIELAARLVFGVQGREYDPAPLPYRDVRLPEKLRVGYYLSGTSPPSLLFLFLYFDASPSASAGCCRRVRRQF